MSVIKSTRNRTVSDFISSSFKRISEKDRTVKHRIEYGEIIDVDLEHSRVKVKKQDGKELEGPTLRGRTESWFFPLITPLTTIHLLYGGLRPGLKVRIHWIGENDPDGIVAVEVIGDINLVSQAFSVPEMETGFNSGALR